MCISTIEEVEVGVFIHQRHIHVHVGKGLLNYFCCNSIMPRDTHDAIL